MAKTIEVKNVAVSGEDKKGPPVFEATGTLEGRDFTARTIQYNGEPIFKVQEADGHQGLKGSAFTRGDRIAVARACKSARLEQFGAGAKARVEPELDTGETVELSAQSDEAADTSGLNEEQQALLDKIAALDEEAA